MTLLAVAGLAGLVEPPTAMAGANPGNPNGGPPLATAGADPEGGDIVALVRGGRATRSRDGRSSCRWFPGSLASPAGGFLEVEPGGGLQLGDSADGGVVHALYGRICNGETNPTWAFVPLVSARQVANIGFDQVRRLLPKPRAVFSPKISATSSPAVAKLPLWFSVPRGQWRPVPATATRLGLSATVTAIPTRLTFEPGEGTASTGCVGPGVQWQPGMVEPVTPPPCSYMYRNASTVAPNHRNWSAQLSIVWQVAWTATNGESGDLGTLTTTTDYAIPVREIEAQETVSPGRG